MMVQRRILAYSLFGVFVSFAVSCSSRYTLTHLPAKRIEFGSSGGYTGGKITYTLLPNGQLFESNGFVNDTHKPLKRKAVKAIFKEAEKVNRSGYRFRENGNLNNYIVLYGGLEPILWQWPASSVKAAPEPLMKLQNLLISNSPKDERYFKK